MTDFDHILIAMALDDPISDVATGLVQAVTAHPETSLELSVDGFDNDPRELWQIPEAMDYFRRLYAHVVILDSGRDCLKRLDPVSKALVLCAIGKATATVAPDGYTHFRTTGEL